MMIGYEVDGDCFYTCEVLEVVLEILLARVPTRQVRHLNLNTGPLSSWPACLQWCMSYNY